jgi:hypothetical protein
MPVEKSTAVTCPVGRNLAIASAAFPVPQEQKEIIKKLDLKDKLLSDV